MRIIRTMLGFLLAGISASAQGSGSKVCGQCHAEIWRRYQLSGMARSSGPSNGIKLPDGEFEASGVRYRINPYAGAYRLNFTRKDTDVHGDETLAWFVGSGTVGRSFLYKVDQFLFQSPVSFYALTGKWDVSPGYQRSGAVNVTRPVEPGCMNCHATQLQPFAGTQNGYRTPPFLEAGVGCERCHGPGRQHASNGGKSPIINPAKLTGERRDSVCAQCHLNGAVRIARVRTQPGEYSAGDLLSSFSAFFVKEGGSATAMTVTSHFERFVRSRCRRESGEKMWCGTCHDPHGEPAKEDRVRYYRAKCESCHAPTACKASKSVRRETDADCTSCHMPKSGVRDAQHAVYTDHAISKTATVHEIEPTTGADLIPFWKNGTDERDLALAYASLHDNRARNLLEKAAKRNPGDLPVERQLAMIYDEAGDSQRAMKLYEGVLKADPTQVPAAVNLGVIYMQRERAPEAIALWKQALNREPGLTATRINLAVAQYQTGDKASGESSLKRALELDPDNSTARNLLTRMHATQ